jgi:LuxR family maltose regulon positive regulatory protein
MSEIREHELRFTGAESKTFFDRALASRPGPGTLTRLEEVTEGWAAGMRMAALLGRGRDVDALLAGLQGTPAQLNEYFVAEVLAQLPARRRDRLLRGALVEPFCADLLSELFAPAEAAGTPDRDRPNPSGEAFIDWADGSGLFLIALDARRKWFRFHHLFRGLLMEQLCHRAAAGEIEDLRRRAAGWLEAHGRLEEAMSQHLAADDFASAAGLVKRHRHELTRREEWNRLRRWLDRLPADLVRRDLELLVIRAWLCENRMRYAEMFDLLDEIEALAAARPPVSPADGLLGEIDALKSIRHYQACDGERTVAASRRALEAIPEGHFNERSYALVLNSLGHQMNGDLEQAESVVLEALRDRSRGGSPYRTRVLIGLGLVYWMDGSTMRVIRTAHELLALGKKHGLAESVDYGRYLLGIASYDRGDLEAAEAALVPLVDRRSSTLANWAHASVALAWTHLGAGAFDRAQELASAVAARGLELQHPEVLSLAEAFEAELALRRGRVHEAAHWARSYRPVVRAPRHRFFLVELTLARVLLAGSTGDCRKRAAQLLEELRKSLSAAHHRRFEAEVLALQALSAERAGREDEALDALRRVVGIAHPRGLVQPFLDLGPDFMTLLERPGSGEPAASFRRVLVAAARPRQTSVPAPPVRRILAEDLSNRELDVLDLLARRLSNKEIAAQLCLSTDTVKRHNTNIFRKLHVGRRREAVEKARHLGILSSA